MSVQRTGRGAPSWGLALAAALPAWVLARLVVLGALELARYLVSHTHPARTLTLRTAHTGLAGWDAAWYASITQHGYAGTVRAGVRFFPLLPALARGLTALGFGAETATVVVANAAALAAGVLLYRLAARETGDEGLARRAAWLLALAPPAFALVMGYADALALALAIGGFLLLRGGRWWWAAAVGVLLGLARPVGFLFAVPAAIEAARGLRAAAGLGGVPRREWWGRAAAVLGAPVGTWLYLGWVWHRFHDPFLPYRVQTSANLHGSFSNPLHTIDHALRGWTHGNVGTGLHVPWLALVIVLVVITCLRFPAAYGAFAAVSVAGALTSSNLDSFERYALGAFPILLAGASLLGDERVERFVMPLLVAGLTGYALLAFLGGYVP